MKPNTPVLMLSVLIPVTPETSPEQVINMIGYQVVEALRHIQEQQAVEEITSADGDEPNNGDPEAIPQQEFNATVQHEEFESYSDATKDDLLGKLGYTAEV